MHRTRTFKRLSRCALGVLFVGALFASQAGLAWADDAEPTWTYPVPTQATDIDKNLVTFGSQGDIWGEILGITDVARNMWSDYNDDGTPSAEGVANDPVVQLYGSDVNVNPNPYYANLIYNANAAEADRVDHYSFADKSGLGTGIDRADTALVDEYGGVSVTMSYRPNIVMGNCATSWQDPGGILLRSDGTTPLGVGNYNTAISAGYDSQVTTIRSLKKGSDYYQDGDNAYNPYYVENLSMYGDVVEAAAKVGTTDVSSYGIGTDIQKAKTVGSATIGSTYAQMYRILEAVKGAMADNPNLITRYGDPEAIAAQYESYGRGLQDYVLSKIADGTVAKKKVAVVYDVSVDNNTVTVYKSSPSDTIEGTASSFSGPYKHMEALENVTENIAGSWNSETDISAGGWSSSYAVTKVLDDVSELKNADCIIMAYSSDYPNLQTVLTAAGIAETDMPPILVNYATTTARGIPGFPMLQTDGLEMMATELGFVYPEIINPVYALAYYYTQFYHVKSDVTTLSNVLSYNIENMSLPAGVTADLSNYSDEIIQSAIDAGLKYYAENKAEIDAQHPKLTTTSYVVLPDTDAVAADKEAANGAAGLIEALDASAVTANDANVAAARAAYDKLTDDQKALVDEAVVAKLEAAEAAVNAANLIKKAEDAAAAAQAAQAAAEAAKGTAEAEAKAAQAAQAAAEAEAAAAKAAQADAEAQAAAASANATQDNTMTVSAKTVKAKAKKKTTVKASKAFKVKDAQGEVVYVKLKGNNKISVAANGKVTVAKGLKKGKTFKVKVKVMALGNDTYKSLAKTVTLKVKVK